MPNEKKRYRPRTTVRGRVVYNRKVHEFTEADCVRVFKRVIERDADENYIQWLGEFLLTLFQLAIAVVFQLYRETFPIKLAELVIKFLSGLIDAITRLGMSGYNFITSAISKAFGLQVIEESFKEAENGDVEG